MLFPLTSYLKILKNTLIVKYLKIFTNKCYPLEIIPSVKYKKEILIDSICNTQDFYITRRVNHNKENLLNEIGILRDDVLQPKEVPMMSLNIMGGKFEHSHIKFRTLKEGNDKWNGKDEIFISDFFKCYEILDSSKIATIFFEGNKINSVIIPYCQPDTTELKKQVDHFFTHVPKPEKGSNGFEFEGKIIFKHDPTNLNYWHLELNVIDFKGDAITFKGATWQKRLFSHIISNTLLVNALTSISYIPSIPRAHYIK